MSRLQTVLIVGAGAIGRRHIEACLKLPANEFSLTVVEPNEANWAALTSVLHGVELTVTWVRNIAELPLAAYDIAVVATQADIRKAVVEQLLHHISLGGLVLEKVLFQNLSEYPIVEALISAKNVKTWVNCPRRQWPGYAALKARYAADIVALEMLGCGWDIGCNGIHFLDLFSYLTNATGVQINSFDLPSPPQPAKREGMLHVSGRCTGVLTGLGNATVPFAIEAREGALAPSSVRLTLRDGSRVDIVEGGPEMVVTVNPNNGTTTVEAFPILFQSALTNKIAESVTTTGTCDLAGFAESCALHVAFLDSLNRALLPYMPQLPTGFCPIT